MSIDTADQETPRLPIAYLGLREATRHFVSNRTGKPVHVSAILRYGLKGAPSVRGEGRIRLALWRHPGGWVTTERAIQDFIQALTRDRLGLDAPTSALRPPVVRRKSHDRAEAQLDAVGI